MIFFLKFIFTTCIIFVVVGCNSRGISREEKPNFPIDPVCLFYLIGEISDKGPGFVLSLDQAALRASNAYSLYEIVEEGDGYISAKRTEVGDAMSYKVIKSNGNTYWLDAWLITGGSQDFEYTIAVKLKEQIVTLKKYIPINMVTMKPIK